MRGCPVWEHTRARDKTIWTMVVPIDVTWIRLSFPSISLLGLQHRLSVGSGPLLVPRIQSNGKEILLHDRKSCLKMKFIFFVIFWIELWSDTVYAKIQGSYVSWFLKIHLIIVDLSRAVAKCLLMSLFDVINSLLNNLYTKVLFYSCRKHGFCYGSK